MNKQELINLNKVKKMLANRNNFGQWKWFELEEIYLKYKALNKTNQP
jgi:hypothetical protein